MKIWFSPHGRRPERLIWHSSFYDGENYLYEQMKENRRSNTILTFMQQNLCRIRIESKTKYGAAGSRSLANCVQSSSAMTLRDLIVDVMRTLWAHKLRAFLTMFGIAWGIVSIVLMVAAGEGLRKGQEEQTQTLGKDVMIVFHGRTSLQAGGMHAGRLVHWEDPDVPVVQAEGVDCEYAIPELEQETVLTHSNFNNASLEVTGSYPQFSAIRSLTVGLGRFYDWNDMREARRVAFLGSDAAKQLFPGRNPVGENVYLNDFPFVVIGVMAKKKQDSSYDGWDVNKIFIPFSAMRRDFPDKPPGTPTTFDQLLVTPKSVEQHEACKHEVRVALARMHRYDPNDKEACPIWDTVQEAKAFRQMTDGMKYFLGAVGIVTLLLGGIGVMNVMLVAVRERTRRNWSPQGDRRAGRNHPAPVFCGSPDYCIAERSDWLGRGIWILCAGEFVAHAGLFCRTDSRLDVRPCRCRIAGRDRDWRRAVPGAQSGVYRSY